ncbi:hypothetical protein [Limibacillus halophilus]|jgi:hypothetical protein
MIRKAALLTGAALMLSACIGEEEKAEIWPRQGDVIYAAEIHVYCNGDRDLRFVGPFRDMDQGKSAAGSLREDSLEKGGGVSEYNVKVWMVRRYIQGASNNPRIAKPNVNALSCV